MSEKLEISSDQSVVWDYPEEDPNYKGNSLDPILNTGPIEERQFTDIFWCILYLCNWGMLIGIAVYAFKNGDPKEVFKPYDSFQNQCGVTGSVSSCPYAFIQFSTATQYTIYCVESCPSNNITTLTTCDGGTPTSYQSKQCIKNLNISQVNSICQPQDNDQLQSDFKTLSNSIGIDNSIQNIDTVWPVTLGVIGISIILSIIVTKLIKYFASYVIWITYFLFVALLVTLGEVCFEYARNDNILSGWLYGIAYTSWAFAGIALLMLICLLSKIRIALAVMRAAADFTNDVMTAELVPFGVLIFTIGFFVFWVFSCTYLIGCATVKQNGNTPFPQIKMNESIGWMLAGQIFGFYWNVNFAISFCQYVIGSACAMWYFHNLGKDLHYPIAKSIYRGLFYHCGSLALGAFILTMIKMIQYAFSFIYKCLKDSVMNNKAAEGCLKCCCSCCSCMIKYFESYVRFINLNAFIMVGLSGKPFCKSAHDAFYLIHRSSTLVSVTDGVGEVFTIIANLFVAISATLCGFFMVTNIEVYSNVSPVLPTIFFAILSLIIASFFMNVYGIAVDTILLCYLADEELNKKATPPKQLQEFLDTYYKKE